MDQLQKRKYYFAKSYKRILARILDMILCTVIFVSLTIAIVATEHNGFSHATSLQSYKYLLITIGVSCVLLIYFILIPFFFSSTLFQSLFRIKYYFPSHKFLSILRRELFLTIMPATVILIYGIILCSIGSSNCLVFFNEFRNATIGSYGLIISLYKIFFTFYAVILLIVITNTCFKNGRKNIIDDFSNSCTIDVSTQTPKSLPPIINVPSNLPGSVSISDLQEVEND